MNPISPEVTLLIGFATAIASGLGAWSVARYKYRSEKEARKSDNDVAIQSAVSEGLRAVLEHFTETMRETKAEVRQVKLEAREEVLQERQDVKDLRSELRDLRKRYDQLLMYTINLGTTMHNNGLPVPPLPDFANDDDKVVEQLRIPNPA